MAISATTAQLVYSVILAQVPLILVFTSVQLMLVVTVQTIMLFDKVAMTYRDHVLTYDLNLPTWPFFAVAWMGDVCAVLLIGIRTWRLITEPQAFAADNKAGH